ncbi:MAG: DNA starvation/stationary phase protection protein [Planctomycetota bacterium]
MPDRLISGHDLQPARQGELLQPCVLAAINTSLNLKQIHWNLRGAKFQIVHEFLDLVIEQARTTSDELAERMVTVGVPAMGRAPHVEQLGLPQVPDAFVTDTQAVELASELLDRTIGILREAQTEMGPIDAVTEDLLIASIQTFEKQLWMLRSHLL